VNKCKLCRKKFKDYQKRGRTRCGSCNTKIRRYRTKAAAIKLLGGKCKKCGWSRDQAALQLHHINPRKKDFIVGGIANKSWDSIKSEIMKCILLCANCHAVEHSTKLDHAFIKEAHAYKGRTFEL